MSVFDLYQRMVARGEYPYRSPRAVPPPEPVLEVLAETVQLVTSYGRWQPEPYGPDPVVFGAAPRVNSPFND